MLVGTYSQYIVYILSAAGDLATETRQGVNFIFFNKCGWRVRCHMFQVLQPQQDLQRMVACICVNSAFNDSFSLLIATTIYSDYFGAQDAAKFALPHWWPSDANRLSDKFRLKCYGITVIWRFLITRNLRYIFYMLENRKKLCWNHS